MLLLSVQWKRDVAFAGFEVSMQMDISAEKMIFGVAGVDPDRRAELVKVLHCDLLLVLYLSSICMGLSSDVVVLCL